MISTFYVSTYVIILSRRHFVYIKYFYFCLINFDFILYMITCFFLIICFSIKRKLSLAFFLLFFLTHQ